jgi:prefoldin subunit 5
MIPVLLEAIKEQQKVIDRLKTDNENLNTRLEKLEKYFPSMLQIMNKTAKNQ